MAGYTPGEQPKPGDVVIKLNTNENPYPPSPRVFEAIRATGADALRRYPSPMADEFRRVAARVHGVSVDQVLAGNPRLVDDYRAGKEKAFNALVGQVMKASQGKANPAQANAILKKKLG